MSSLVLDVSPVGHVPGSDGLLDPVPSASLSRAFVQAHPREKGFRVLSRLARVHADGACYTPRHRREVSADVHVLPPIAS